jgi:hypothetical protein
MKTKRLLCPQRLRTVPRQFSWIDQRLVREGHIVRCGGTQALALYLLLVTVADSFLLAWMSIQLVLDSTGQLGSLSLNCSALTADLEAKQSTVRESRIVRRRINRARSGN